MSVMPITSWLPAYKRSDFRFELRFARTKATVLGMMAADGIVDRIGADHFHPSIDDAVNAALAD